MPKREYSPEEKEEYQQRKKAEKEDFLKRREEAVYELAENPGFYRKYLQTQPLLSESCLNTVWLTKNDVSGTIFHTINDWNKIGMDVDRSCPSTTLLSAESYVNSSGQERVGYRVINVYSNQQLKVPYDVHPERQTTASFTNLLKNIVSWRIDLKEAKLSDPYKISLKKEGPKTGSITLSNHLKENPVTYAFFLAVAVADFYLQEKMAEHNKDYLQLVNPSLTARDAGFMICAKYLNPNTLMSFPVSAERLKGLPYVLGKTNYNKELKAERSIADFYCKRIDGKIKKEQT